MSSSFKSIYRPIPIETRLAISVGVHTRVLKCNSATDCYTGVYLLRGRYQAQTLQLKPAKRSTMRYAILTSLRRRAHQTEVSSYCNLTSAFHVRFGLANPYPRLGSMSMAPEPTSSIGISTEAKVISPSDECFQTGCNTSHVKNIFGYFRSFSVIRIMINGI